VRSGKGEMPPFDDGDLKDSDLAAIYAYLKSLTK
jgi:mono/diheme cytochrome c family protein